MDSKEPEFVAYTKKLETFTFKCWATHGKHMTPPENDKELTDKDKKEQVVKYCNGEKTYKDFIEHIKKHYQPKQWRCPFSYPDADDPTGEFVECDHDRYYNTK